VAAGLAAGADPDEVVGVASFLASFLVPSFVPSFVPSLAPSLAPSFDPSFEGPSVEADAPSELVVEVADRDALERLSVL